MDKIKFKVKEKSKVNFSMGMGIKEIYPPIENLEVTPTKEKQVFTHENSYGYDNVTVNPIPEIKLQDKDITINENGIHSIVADDEYDGLNQVNVTVDAIEDLTEELNTYNTELTEQETTINDIVEALKGKATGGESAKLQDKTVILSGSSVHEIVPDEGYDGFSSIKAIINLLDTTNYSAGGWVVQSGKLVAEDGTNIYRFNREMPVIGGETLYLSKHLCCYFNTSQNDVNTTGNLIITVPSNASQMVVRIFQADFETFNPTDYIITRTPIEESEG